MPLFAALLLLSRLLCDCIAQPDGPGTAGVETRTFDEMYEAAKKEGGVVTVWHGGDEPAQRNGLKEAFESRFPGIKVNITVDVSKYLDGRVDEQLAARAVYVDNIILQTLHDFPRWEKQGALLNYAPLGFEQIYPEFKASSAAWYGIGVFSWMNVLGTNKLPNRTFTTFEELTHPGYKDKIVLTWPNDDDAVLFTFHLILEKLGKGWFDRLLQNNPRWVRGTETPLTMIIQANDSVAASFTTAPGFDAIPGIQFGFCTDANFTSWPQTGAILKDAPHPESAKLFHSFMLTPEYQKVIGWSVRKDVPPPTGFPNIFDVPNTDPTAFGLWMADRPNVERTRLRFEDMLGTPQGPSPLFDGQ
ncbi:hypothetical protein HIM_05199 [Hirsutella minnesotensis 3608]|uniref:ABC-type Fe3+ transport system n=1 Tax=Hirsutella minnesotensis 3608 TaxID=1043627 RepID=A0A0F7ZUV1_9HYPO|nr:hypothetical protein HIM_05199 [Hirsutella minnesotensis 3608]